MIVSTSTDFSGTEGTIFRVEMLNDAGTSWKWSKKVLIGGWDAYTTVTDYDLDTPIELALGVKVEFVESAKSDYNDGDYWTWIMTVDMKLDEDEAGGYTNLKVMENGDKKNLIILNKNSGGVVEVKDFESTTPSINENIVNIGSSNSIDICNKNKEIYIARGINNKPKWVGYTKNSNFDPPSEIANIFSDDAYRTIDVESTFTKILDDFVTLRGTKEADDVVWQKNSKIVAGIKYGEDRLYVCEIVDLDENTPTGTVYSYKLNRMPIRVRLDYSTFNATGQKHVIGVAVMTEPAVGVSGDDTYRNSIEFWKIPPSSKPGAIATRQKIIHLVKPANFDIEEPDNKGFSDFLIVPTYIDHTDASCEFHAIFSYELSQEETSSGLKGQRCLYRVDGIDTLSDGAVITSEVKEGSNIADGFYIGMTPKLDFQGDAASPLANTVNQFVDMYRDSDNAHVRIGSLVKILTTTNINLAIGGYDANGENPRIHFTANLKPPVQGSSGLSIGDTSAEVETFGPVWRDNAENLDGEKTLWVVCTVTFVSPIDTISDTQKTPFLIHFRHTGLSNPNVGWNIVKNFGGETTINPNNLGWLKSSLGNADMPPATYPLFASGDGRKYNVYGDIGNHNGARRALSYYNITNKQICTFEVPFQTGGQDEWDSANKIWIFPNPNLAIYTKFSDASDDSDWGQTRGRTSFYTLDATNEWADKKRYRLGDNDLQLPFRDTSLSEGSNFGQIGLPWEKEASQIIMAPITGDSNTMVEHWYNATMNAGAELGTHDNRATETYTEAVDEINGADTYLSFTSPETDSSITWKGGSSLKVFYKISLIYDGYQESSLLSPTAVYSAGSAWTDGLGFNIRIKTNWDIPQRVNAVALYRGDSTAQNSDNPDGLYRFVKEIPLTDFASDETNGRYDYAVVDDGDTEGSYSAINGIPETMKNLSINYTYCTEQNGYMFIGKCRHFEFGDAHNVVFRSQPGKYSIFNWSTDFVQVPFSITAMIGFMGKIYVFGSNEILIINPETLVIEDTITGIGCVGPKAIYTTSTGLYWFDENNIYSASPRIMKIGQSILSVDTYGWYNLSSDVKKGAVGGFDVNRQAYLVFFTTGSDKRCWAYSTMMNRWDLWETAGTVMDTEQSSDGHCILLLKDGRICKYLAGANRRSWEWESKKITFGSDTIFKKVRVAKIDASNRANTSIKYKTDISTEASAWQDGTPNSDNYGSAWLGNSIKIDSAHSKARWAKFQLKGTNDSAGSDYKGYSLGVIFKPKRPK
jgi:hypothetical protein